MIQVLYLFAVHLRRRLLLAAWSRDQTAGEMCLRLRRTSPQRRRSPQTTNTSVYAVRCAETTRKRYGRGRAPVKANMSPRPAETVRWPPPHAPLCPTECPERKSFRSSVQGQEILPIFARNNSKIAYLGPLPPPLHCLAIEQTFIQQSDSGGPPTARPTSAALCRLAL